MLLCSETPSLDYFILIYVTGEAKHNIDKLVDDLKHVMKLEVSQNEDECPNIVRILDSMVNVKTLIKGITEKITINIVNSNHYACYFSSFIVICSNLN